MNVSPIDVEVQREHYLDLLREAETERLITQAGLRTELHLVQNLYQVAQKTVCHISFLSQTRVCALGASLA